MNGVGMTIQLYGKVIWSILFRKYVKEVVTGIQVKLIEVYEQFECAFKTKYS